LPRHGRQTEVLRAPEGFGHPSARGHVRRRDRGAVMLLPFLVFVFVTASIMVGYAAVTYLPGMLEARRLDRRLRDVSFDTGPSEENSEDSVIKRLADGPLPGVDKLISKTHAGSWLSHLIEQSGV